MAMVCGSCGRRQCRSGPRVMSHPAVRNKSYHTLLDSICLKNVHRSWRDKYTKSRFFSYVDCPTTTPQSKVRSGVISLTRDLCAHWIQRSFPHKFPLSFPKVRLVVNISGRFLYPLYTRFEQCPRRQKARELAEMSCTDTRV